MGAIGVMEHANRRTLLMPLTAIIDWEAQRHLLRARGDGTSRLNERCERRNAWCVVIDTEC